MKDNIVDFNSRRAIKSTAGNSKQAFNSLTEFLTSLPQNALMADVAERFAEQIGRLVLYATIVAKVSELIESAGLDPDHFELDEDSYDRFMDLEIDERDEKEFMSTVVDETLDRRENIWNGPWFDWEDGDTTYRVATSVILNAQGIGALGMDLLRRGWDDDFWEMFDGKNWLEGPPEDVFDYLVSMRDDMLDDDDDGEYEWFDDEDEEWESSIDSMLLSPATIDALHAAGIYAIDELKKMSDTELLRIKGIGKKRVEEIKEALEYED